MEEKKDVKKDNYFANGDATEAKPDGTVEEGKEGEEKKDGEDKKKEESLPPVSLFRLVSQHSAVFPSVLACCRRRYST